MAGYNDISKFNDFLVENWVRRLTVTEYLRRGRGVYSRKSGEIMRHPDFGGGYMTTVRLRLHQNLEDRFGGVVEVFLTCDYDEDIAFEVSEDGTEGVLRGFTRDGYEVDIVAHARTR